MKTAGCFKRFMRRKGAVFGTDPRMEKKNYLGAQGWQCAERSPSALE